MALWRLFAKAFRMLWSQQLRTSLTLLGLASASLVAAPTACRAQSAALSSVRVQLVSDESEAVLAILSAKKAGKSISEADWRRLFSSEGYVRLKKREAEMERTFQDSDFKSFVLSDELAGRADALQETLKKWKSADITGAARRALAYLPQTAAVRAKIYPVIKPQTNSFVFEAKTDPAIFLYVNPSLSAAQFENTLAHELHHIGQVSSCSARLETEEFIRLPTPVRTVLEWVSAFGEGVAMLAAAGGPDVHPHATSPPEDRARWDKDMANFNQDLRRVEKFFLDVLEERLVREEEIRNVGFSFFGVQGPWYTVGWKMAATIEKVHGRPKLIECLCDPANFLRTYNQAAAEQNKSASKSLALWSPALIERITVASRSSAGEVR